MIVAICMCIRMATNKIKSLIMQNWIFYLLGIIIIFGVKIFYSAADSNGLKWILRPTAWWVRTLSGISFEYDPYLGYVNHSLRFIIAPSCSGTQFMVITITTLIFSFVHRMETKIRGFCWIVISLVSSYLFTIFVNSLRIVLSIYLPLYLQKSDIYSGWMTPARLHTSIGIIIYFSSLCIIYHIAEYVSRTPSLRLRRQPDCNKIHLSGTSFVEIIHKCITPMFWYFSITLGIPFLNKAYKDNLSNFIEYTILVTSICMVIVFIFFLVSVIREHFSKG